MIFQMVCERLREVEGGWNDSAESLRRLATSLQAAGIPLTRVKLFGEPDPTKDPRDDAVGFQDECIDEADTLKDLVDEDLEPGHPLVSSGTPAGTIDRAIDALSNTLAELLGLVSGSPGFEEEVKPDPPDPTRPPLNSVEVVAARNSLDQLKKLITKNLAALNELREEVSSRFYLSGIRDSVEGLAGYPILTSEAFGGSSPGQGTSSRSSDGGVSLRKSVDSAIREVLGRIPRLSDTRSLLISLEQSFSRVEASGHVEYQWTPRSLRGQTDLGGGVTGGQASLYARAKAVEGNVISLLDGLYALREDADEELTGAIRAIIRSEFIELVAELGMEGGPRRVRVDSLLELLFEQKVNVQVNGQLKEAQGHLGVLKHEFGLEASYVNTLDEEVNFTNFIALFDYVDSIRTSWKGFRDSVFGKDLGTRLVLLSRALSVSAESVQEANESMDSVFVGASERQVAFFTLSGGERVFVGELLEWIRTFTTDEAPNLVHAGGRRGAEAIVPTTIKLGSLVERLIAALPYQEGLPVGMRHPRVVNPLRELRGHLDLVRRHAEEVINP